MWIWTQLGKEQKTLQPFPSPKKGLHNFESFFTSVFIRDCPEAELELITTASWIQITSD